MVYEENNKLKVEIIVVISDEDSKLGVLELKCSLIFFFFDMKYDCKIIEKSLYFKSFFIFCMVFLISIVLICLVLFVDLVCFILLLIWMLRYKCVMFLLLKIRFVVLDSIFESFLNWNWLIINLIIFVNCDNFFYVLIFVILL